MTLPESLSDVLAPFPLDRFIERHWLEEPLYVPAAGRADRFRALIDWPDVDRLLDAGSSEEVRARVAKRGEVFSQSDIVARGSGPASYHPGPSVDPQIVGRECADGASVIMNYCDRRLPALGTLARGVEYEVGADTATHVFASPAGGWALPLHMDMPEIVILQIDGAKRWRVYPPRTAYPARAADPRPQDCAVPKIDVELEAGDVLYVPGGWPHRTEAAGPSLHVGVAVRMPTGLEFLDWLRGRAELRSAFRRRLPLAAGPEAVAERFEALAGEFARTARAAPVLGYLRWRDGGARPRAAAAVSASGPEGPHPDALVALRVPRRPVIVEGSDPDAFEVFAGGRRHVVDARARGIVELAARGRPVTAAALAGAAAGVPADDAAALVRGLIGDGLLVELPRRR